MDPFCGVTLCCPVTPASSLCNPPGLPLSHLQLWPFGGMYTTMAGITFDAEGAALTYGVVFAAGSGPAMGTGTVYWMNFTSPTRAEIDGIFEA